MAGHQLVRECSRRRNVAYPVAVHEKTDYIYTDKELQQLFGIDWSDSFARFQTASGVFTSPDPLAEKYYPLSPYAYCAGDPVNLVDHKGDSLAILNAGGFIGHLAMLIQHADGQWGYYSYNGDIIYVSTGGKRGAKGIAKCWSYN